MGFANLGTVFGPSLLRDQGDYDPLNESLMISSIIASVIENKDFLFSEPPSPQ
jgi:hypothetical protein